MKTYKDIIQRMVHGHRFKSTDKVLEECNIPYNSYAKVSNSNSKQPNGNPYNTPLEWVVPLTKATNDYALVEQLCDDVGGLFIPPDKVAALQKKGPELILLLKDILRVIEK